MDLEPKDPTLGESIFSILPPRISRFSLCSQDEGMGCFAIHYKEPQRSLISEIGSKGWPKMVGAELHVDQRMRGPINRKNKVFTFEGLRGEKLLKFLGGLQNPTR